MKVKCIITAALLLLSVSVSAQQGSLIVDHVDGLHSAGSLAVNTPVTFHIRLVNITGSNIVGLTNGFRVYSTTGVQWDATTATATGAITGDMFEQFFVNEFSTDGAESDTIGFGGFRLFKPGIPSGFNEIIGTMTIGPIDPIYVGGQICLDSSFFQPAGMWKWSTSSGDNYPSWDGPHCYAIADTITPQPHLTYVDPQQAAQGQALTVTLFGRDTHFSQASSAEVYLSIDTTFLFSPDTLYSSGVNVVNDTMIEASFVIPANLQPGLWDITYTGVMPTGPVSYTLMEAFAITPSMGPHIVSVEPDVAYQGQALWVAITGSNTNFGMGSGTSVRLLDGLGMTEVWASSVDVANSNLMGAYFVIPADAWTGQWGLTVFEVGFDSVALAPAMTILSAGDPEIAYVFPDSAPRGEALWVSIVGRNTAFTQASWTTAALRRGIFGAIMADQTVVIADTLVNAYFDLPVSSEPGLWGVDIFKDDFLYVSKEDAFMILDALEPPVISVVPDSLWAELQTGQTTTKTLTISNYGGGVLDWSIAVPMPFDSLTPVSSEPWVPEGDITASTRTGDPYASPPPYTTPSVTQPAPANIDLAPTAGAALFVTTYTDSLIKKLNPVTGEVVGVIPRPGGSSAGPDGLAYDGNYVYFIDGFGGNSILRLDQNTGAVVDSFALPGVESIDGLACDGHFLYALGYSSHTIYKVDVVTRLIVDQHTFAAPYTLGGGITFGGNRGTLFVGDFYANVFEIDPVSWQVVNGFSVPLLMAQYLGLGYSNAMGLLYLFDVDAGMGYAMDPDSGAVMFSFAAAGVTAAAADETPSSSWLSVFPPAGQLAPGQSVQVEVTFDADGLASGMYFSDIVISSNDPLQGQVFVPVWMNVAGGPEIEWVNPDHARQGDTVVMHIFGFGTRFYSTRGVEDIRLYKSASEILHPSSYSVYADTAVSAIFQIPINASEGYWDVGVYDTTFGVWVTKADAFRVDPFTQPCQLIPIPNHLSFTVEYGSIIPVSQQVMIYSECPGIPFLIYENVEWLDVVPDTGWSNDSVTVTVDVTGLEPGPYHTEIWVWDARFGMADTIAAVIDVDLVVTTTGVVSNLSLDHVTGLTFGGNLAVGDTVTFHIRMNNDTENTINGLTDGFVIYSPDGAQWGATIAETVGSITPTYLDQFFINYFGNDGMGADTVGFGGFRLATPGIPAGFNEVVYTLKIGPLSAADVGKHICLDSTYYPPAGLWKWSTSGGDVLPTWDGPHCFGIDDAISACSLSVWPEWMEFSTTVGGPNPPCQEMNIRSDCWYRISEDAPWLFVDTVVGPPIDCTLFIDTTIFGSDTTFDSMIRVDSCPDTMYMVCVNSAGLPEGHYHDTVFVTAPESADSVKYTVVDLMVNEPGGQCGQLFGARILAVDSAGYVDSLAFFGTSDTALDGLDPSDLIEPLWHAEGMIRVYFPHPEIGLEWSNLIGDVKAPIFTGAKYWLLNVETKFAANLSLHMTEQWGTEHYTYNLLDATWGALVNDFDVNGYDYFSPAGTRSFLLEVICEGSTCPPPMIHCPTGIDTVIAGAVPEISVPLPIENGPFDSVVVVGVGGGSWSNNMLTFFPDSNEYRGFSIKAYNECGVDSCSALYYVIYDGCRLRYFTNFRETGKSYPVVFKDEPVCGLIQGDEIGLFDRQQGLLVGAMAYCGQPYPLSIPAWEADPAHLLPGYIPGNELEVKLYRPHRDSIVCTDLYGNCLHFNECNYAVVDSLICHSCIEHFCSSFDVMAGRWQLLSLPLSPIFDMSMSPINCDVSQVFGQFDDLDIVKNDEGEVFIPKFGVNSIGCVSLCEGYNIFKNFTNEQFCFVGTEVDPGGCLVQAQRWNMIGYPMNCLMPIDYALSSISMYIDIVQDDEGRAYIPRAGINTIGEMVPGKGYYIFHNSRSDLMLYYPSCLVPFSAPFDQPDVIPYSKAADDNVTHYEFVKTGLPLALVLKDIGTMLSIGDEIAVFDGDLCVGAVKYNGEKNLVLNAWKADADHGLPGYTSGHAADIRAYLADGTERSLLESPGLLRFDSQPYFSIDVGKTTSLPEHYELAQNYPNPFNPNTILRFALPEAGHVTLDVYNLLGQRVSTLVDEHRQAGIHETVWNGRDDRGSEVSSGIYFYRLQVNDYTESKKMILMK